MKTALLWLAAACAVIVGVAVGTLLAVLRAAVKILPYALVFGLVLWMCTGCVFQPIHVEVYIPTTVQTGGDVVLDTVGNKLSEVTK